MTLISPPEPQPHVEPASDPAVDESDDRQGSLSDGLLKVGKFLWDTKCTLLVVVIILLLMDYAVAIRSLESQPASPVVSDPVASGPVAEPAAPVVIIPTPGDVCAPGMKQWQGHIARWSADSGIPYGLLHALIEFESGGNPCQVYPENRDLDGDGAIDSSYGLFQVVSAWGRPSCLRYDIECNATVGMKILESRLPDRGSWSNLHHVWIALRGYNGAGSAAASYADRVMALYRRDFSLEVDTDADSSLGWQMDNCCYVQDLPAGECIGEDWKDGYVAYQSGGIEACFASDWRA